MMAFYKASEKFGMECMQLTPAFDIDLFAEPDNEEYNMVGDEMENPFFGTAPAGTQQMTLVINLLMYLPTLNCKPSLNTQSCNRRPLCSTFTFENVRSPRNTVLFQKNETKNSIFFLLIYYATL